MLILKALAKCPNLTLLHFGIPRNSTLGNNHIKDIDATALSKIIERSRSITLLDLCKSQILL